MRNKWILKRLLIFVTAYLLGLLLLQTPIIRKSYVSIYNSVQETVFNILHPTVSVDFDHFTGEKSEDFDYSVTLFQKSDLHSPLVQINQGAGKTAIVPFILLLALIIAGPGSIKKKLLLGAAISVVILLILAMKYTLLISQNAPQLSPTNGSVWISLSTWLQGIYRTHEALYILIFSMWLMAFWTTDSINSLFPDRHSKTV